MSLSDILSSTSGIIAIVVVLLSIVYYLVKNRNVLPGPKGLPFFGLFPLLTDEEVHLQLAEFGKIYGDLFSFTYLGNLIINLGSAKAIREVHVNKSEYFAGRFSEFSMLTDIMEDGVSMVNGEAWKMLRKFFVQRFKEYGLNVLKDNTADTSYNSLMRTMEDLHQRKGVPLNAIELLTEKCMEPMRTVLFGQDGVSDENLLEMNRAYGIALECMGGRTFLLIGPVGKLLFHMTPKLKKAMHEHELLRNLLLETVKNMESKMNVDHPTCIIEDFLKEKIERRKKGDPSWEYFSDKALVNSLTQIIGDGMLGVAFFIGCFLHALIEHPEEQENIYKELLDVVGPTRQPTNEDRGKLSYTNAFMNEVARTSNFFSLFPSLKCTREVVIRGYRIPKGAITMLNMWQAHHDPEEYENPDKFDPTRFIPKDGKSRPELPVLFGMGKRACIGESYVMLQAFLYLTNIVKNFKISEPENPVSKSNLFLMSGNMELIFTPRAENKQE